MHILSRLSLAALTAALLAPSPLLAGAAQLTLAPTRIVLEGNDRYATVTVKNSGDGIGRYRIELVDATMQPNGGIKVLENGARDPFSATDILSISPRSMTLKPDDFQTIRLMVKDTSALKDGEYRSHLKVKLTENDLNETTEKPNGDATGITIKPRISMIIPVIVRRGKSDFHVEITGGKILPPAEGESQTQLQLNFAFSGNRSVIGDVKVTHTDAAGKETLLKFFPGVAIYRGTALRDLVVPLEVPAGLDVHAGKMLVTYSAQDKDGGKQMASKELTP